VVCQLAASVQLLSEVAAVLVAVVFPVMEVFLAATVLAETFLVSAMVEASQVSAVEAFPTASGVLEPFLVISAVVQFQLAVLAASPFPMVPPLVPDLLGVTFAGAALILLATVTPIHPRLRTTESCDASELSFLHFLPAFLTSTGFDSYAALDGSEDITCTFAVGLIACYRSFINVD
jgi:hypothetical protein